MPEPTVTPAQTADVAQTPAPVAVEPTTDPTADHDLNVLPDWGRKAITRANAEAVGYRLKLKAFEDAQAEAERKAAEERGEFQRLYTGEQTRVKDLEQQLAQRDHAALQVKVATAAKIPLTFAARLAGTTEAELAADAAEIAALLVPPVPGVTAANPAASRTQTLAPFDPLFPPRLSQIKFKT